MSNIPKSRFYLSLLSILILGGLAFFAIATGESVTPPLCVTAIGGIAGYYTYGKTTNNTDYIEAEEERNKQQTHDKIH